MSIAGLSPVLKEIAQSPSILKDVYGDLAKPGVVEVGKALGTVLGLGNTVLWPIIMLNERAKLALQRNLEKYREELNKVPSEQVVAVPPEIGVPILEKLTYVTNEELSSLYIRLLAKAASFENCRLAHPSFVNIINNLSPDEAILLPYLASQREFLEAIWVAKDPARYGRFHPIASVLTGLEKELKLTFPNNMAAYFSNFEGLGLIDIRRDRTSTHNHIYERLESLYADDPELLPTPLNYLELSFKRGTIEITVFGSLFQKACLDSPNGGSTRA